MKPPSPMPEPSPGANAGAPEVASGSALVDALARELVVAGEGPVELVQTHISWVLLGRTQAIKLKKPVRLPFVDFSTAERRCAAARDELRLNRRLAPSLYLEVRALTGSADAPRQSGEGPVIDCVLVMRRFAAGALLAERLAAGRLGVDELDRLAVRIAAFHRGLPGAPATSGYGTPARVAQDAADVLERITAAWQAAGRDDAALRERFVPVRDWVLAQPARLGPHWRRRLAGGHVRECHGDLHLANTVVLDDGEVTAFDCIEFDPALRWTDTMSDVGFLTMDLHAHGRRDLAACFLDAYLRETGDHAGLAVLRHYQVYRALVRTLVGALATRASGAREASGPDYLECASRLVGESGRARLLITHGLSGSGKSRLAARLQDASGAVRLRSDVERKRLHGLAPLDRPGAATAALYAPAATERTFAYLADAATAALAGGFAVIVDAAFLRRAERERMRAVARACGVPFTILHCEAPPALLRQRLAERAARADDPSDADARVLANQERSQEALDDAERAMTIAVDTAAPIDIDALARHWALSR